METGLRMDMEFTGLFILNSILFGIGLAMDAFTVSLANGLAYPDMSRRRMILIAGTFAGFQIAMPLIGWALMHAVVSAAEAIVPFIPWIAFGLLLFLGIRMLRGGIKNDPEKSSVRIVTVAALIFQGVATSIDALSVGVTISDLTWPYALTESVIIGAVTFAVCMAGITLGRKVGTKLSSKAEIIGGLILIGIGIEILITGLI